MKKPLIRHQLILTPSEYKILMEVIDRSQNLVIRERRMAGKGILSLINVMTKVKNAPVFNTNNFNR